ncbi:MAG TPA: lysozyme inhibitor LprI family protein [Myxococcota bacterium]|nr:lysozyme inhibitor LprI family protein [Myxococcota bacterium]HRY95547.1 lysozyme inhibitor LprI family protein [Myxococcota bacterium]HSA21700.1 lysozyme inhibitor LprI family protein [Myxococcota bacterium]
MRGVSVLALTGALLCGPAWGQSFDCRKASTKAEKRICGDPALALPDVALAKAYKAALKKAAGEARELKAEQRRWLESRRDRCVPDTCMRAVMLERAGALERFAADRGGVTGSYSAGHSDLELLDLGDGRVRFSVNATWQGPEPQQIHTGELCGLVTWEDGSARFSAAGGDCDLRFRFEGEGLVVTQTGACDFGAHVTAQGTYARRSSRPPVLSLCELP